MKLYLAGPMTGYPRWNFDAFAEAREALREIGFEVHCPAEEDLKLGFDPDAPVEEFTEDDYLAALQRDVIALKSCDAIAVLPGWTKSRGAKLEVAVSIERGILVEPVERFLSWKGAK